MGRAVDIERKVYYDHKSKKSNAFVKNHKQPNVFRVHELYEHTLFFHKKPNTSNCMVNDMVSKTKLVQLVAIEMKSRKRFPTTVN